MICDLIVNPNQSVLLFDD